MTLWNSCFIGGEDRKDDLLKANVNRTISAVGGIDLVLRNLAGKYNSVFNVNDNIALITDPGARTVFGGKIDGGNAVKHRARDLESTFDEYSLIHGYDGAQSLLYQNDYEWNFPNATQRLHTVLTSVFADLTASGRSPITYTPPVTSPVVGAFEFKEGSSFISELQELHRRAGYIFSVDDGFIFHSGAPGYWASGVNYYCSPGISNVIDTIDVLELDSDKLYNKIQFYGKNPMYDSYSEQTSSFWISPGMVIVDDPTNFLIGGYSLVAYNTNPVTANIIARLSLPAFNYNTFDFSKGRIECWSKYDNVAGVPGTPGAGTCAASEQIECRLTDTSGNAVSYYGADTLLYEGEWGWLSYTVGYETETTGVYSADHWTILIGTEFNWDSVNRIEFTAPGGVFAREPSHFWIDGLTFPIPAYAFAEDAASQAAYGIRPYTDTLAHIQSQNGLQRAATQMLIDSKSPSLGAVTFTAPFDYRLRYATQSIDIDFPALGLNSIVAYVTELNTVIEPHMDVANGYGFDAIQEITALPTSGTAYDMSRLRPGMNYSATNRTQWLGGGIRAK